MGRAAEAKTRGGYSPLTRLGVILGLVIPYFMEFLGLVSSLLGTFFVLGPMALYWALAAKLGVGISIATRIRHVVVVCMGLVGLLFGTWASLLDLKAVLAAS